MRLGFAETQMAIPLLNGPADLADKAFAVVTRQWASSVEDIGKASRKDVQRLKMIPTALGRTCYACVHASKPVKQ